jgi:hypothetical protein
MPRGLDHAPLLDGGLAPSPSATVQARGFWAMLGQTSMPHWVNALHYGLE